MAFRSAWSDRCSSAGAVVLEDEDGAAWCLRQQSRAQCVEHLAQGRRFVHVADGLGEGGDASSTGLVRDRQSAVDLDGGLALLLLQLCLADRFDQGAFGVAQRRIGLFAELAQGGGVGVLVGMRLLVEVGEAGVEFGDAVAALVEFALQAGDLVLQSGGLGLMGGLGLVLGGGGGGTQLVGQEGQLGPEFFVQAADCSRGGLGDSGLERHVRPVRAGVCATRLAGRAGIMRGPYHLVKARKPPEILRNLLAREHLPHVHCHYRRCVVRLETARCVGSTGRGRRRAVAGTRPAAASPGGVTASTEVWNRGMRAEDSKSLVNPLETKCNCGTAACTRRLINGDASPQSALDRG
jgi:hypothetical protein